MREIVYFVATSLDGYIARKDGGIDWLFTDGDYGYKDFYDSVDLLLVGRKTFELALSFPDYPYAGKRCVVFSRSWEKLEMPDTNVELSKVEPAEAARRYKAEKGGRIWCVGGGRLASALLSAGLIDEVVLSVHPAALGDGIPLFERREAFTPFRLVKSEPFPSGLVQLTYRKG
jgi:dihydrofolate reductase